MHQAQMTISHSASTMQPGSMHVSANLPTNHFLSNPTMGNSNASAGPSQVINPQLASNAPCSTLFVASLGQFVTEQELKELFARGAGMEPRPEYMKKHERDLKTFLMAST